MPRLIDADALKEQFNFPDEAGRMGELIGEVIKAVIDDAPTVEERKVGEWITKSTNGEVFNCCSKCGYVEFDTLRNYCPNCGARMEL